MSLRERKKRLTRERLVREGLRLFVERGYDETSVDEIAEAADVSPRTFFRYFPTKADVVFADLPARRAAVRAALDRDETTPIHERIRDVLIDSIDLLGEDRGLLAARTKLVTQTPPLQTRMLELFASAESMVSAAYAQQLGVSPSSLTPRLAAAITVGSGRSAMLAWSADPSTDLESAIRRSFALTGSTVKRILRGD
jgi:AcrR family transcriptional regulator